MQNRDYSVIFASKIIVLMADYHFTYRQFMLGKMAPFYETFYARLIMYATRILGERLAYVAEDCVQSAVLSTYLHKNEMDDMDKWRACLLTAVRNNALMQLRRDELRKKYENHGMLSQNEAEDVRLAMIEQDVYTELFAAIDTLPEKYRQIFELCYARGLKNADVAEILNVAEITVKKRKAKMIELLREKLGPDIDGAYLFILMGICLKVQEMVNP